MSDADGLAVPGFLCALGLACGVAMALTSSVWPIVPTVAFFFWAAVGQIRGHRRHLRALDGQCPVCGYDLRATPERCPPCGHITNKNDPARASTAG